MLKRYRISVGGVVQGVGFRPFIRRLASFSGLCGTVANTGAGVVIEIDAPPAVAETFAANIRSESPAAARIETLELAELGEAAGYTSFEILRSEPKPDSFTLISADIAICGDCLREIADPRDRRYAYPFINCTNCGPRYSITRSVPYDRANTTMAPFEMCSDCLQEYGDPNNRRFHAEPIACPACGPRLTVAVEVAIDALKAGQIVAIRGLGGFQLACDAHSAAAVGRLRTMKKRSRKPFAVMMRDAATVALHCNSNPVELALLKSQAAPVVLLNMRRADLLPPDLAPGLRELGVMLPCTPLHHLLFRDGLSCLVMTSGNISEEPIVVSNEDARRKLTPLSDMMLAHDREIFMRVDDSVVREFDGVPRVLRRARGYAPEAINLGFELPEVLGCGGELKNTFCITRGRYAIPSQHIGDMENPETLEFFEETLRNLKQVYRATPRLIAHDLHPDYRTTRWAWAQPEPKIGVQHHHAHIASCMAENGLQEKVIGVAFDGAGYGTDGQIWGGEFLVCDYAGFQRCGHLRYTALPGGDRAGRQGWRMAAAHLFDAIGPEFRRVDLPCWSGASPAGWKVIHRMLERPGLLTSSCGRLFDAVAAICGISQESGYEGESAMLLEAAAGDETDETYTLAIDTRTAPWTIDTRPMLGRIAGEIAAGRSPTTVSRCFHNSIAHMIKAVCSKLRATNGVNQVCLSGGTFQNFTLLSGAVRLLRQHGFHVFLHSQVPPNDGGISLGQAAIGAAFLAGTAGGKGEVDYEAP